MTDRHFSQTKSTKSLPLQLMNLQLMTIVHKHSCSFERSHVLHFCLSLLNLNRLKYIPSLRPLCFSRLKKCIEACKHFIFLLCDFLFLSLNLFFCLSLLYLSLYVAYVPSQLTAGSPQRASGAAWARCAQSSCTGWCSTRSPWLSRPGGRRRTLPTHKAVCPQYIVTLKTQRLLYS